MEPRTSEAVLVVVQGDAVCTDWMSHWGPSPEGGWALLEQEEWESRRAFQDRLARALGRASLDGHVDQTIVLVIGSAADRATLGERWGVSTILLQHLAAVGGGRFVMVQGYGGDARGERELEVLARELADEWEESGVTVTTRVTETPRSFDRVALRSDVRAAVRERELAQTA